MTIWSKCTAVLSCKQPGRRNVQATSQTGSYYNKYARLSKGKCIDVSEITSYHNAEGPYLVFGVLLILYVLGFFLCFSDSTSELCKSTKTSVVVLDKAFFCPGFHKILVYNILGRACKRMSVSDPWRKCPCAGVTPRSHTLPCTTVTPSSRTVGLFWWILTHFQ